MLRRLAWPALALGMAGVVSMAPQFQSSTKEGCTSCKSQPYCPNPLAPGAGKATSMTAAPEGGSMDKRDQLSPEAYYVTQECGTERPFTGKYWNHHEPGVYACVVCGTPLFRSDDKYDSGSGWPSFTQPASSKAVGEKEDRSHFSTRTEVHCSKCQAHLGHVFEDGPQPTGLRYCINSAALTHKSEESEHKKD